ncbi:3235_t:CDS:2 [Entrophospora sp. SA101]|nr:3235_t:CDS:2 [Entrophospora sp. SA101]
MPKSELEIDIQSIDRFNQLTEAIAYASSIGSLKVFLIDEDEL